MQRLVWFDGDALHIRDKATGDQVVIRDTANAQAVMRALVQFLREKGVEPTVAPTREISFRHAR